MCQKVRPQALEHKVDDERGTRADRCLIGSIHQSSLWPAFDRGRDPQPTNWWSPATGADPIRWVATARGVPDRLGFGGLPIRLVVGASWGDLEAILDFEVSGRFIDWRNRWNPPC